MRARFLSLFAGLLIAGCGGGEETEPPDAPGQPAGWDDELRLPIAEDRDADADVVEIDLTAREAGLQVRPGVTTQVRTYDGGLPGPLIRAKRGDRLRAHFHNDLPDPTTIHWHGLRVPVEMDGAPDMPKPPVGSGEGFDYDFVLPDAGLFWYHPHVDSAAQVGSGLYGAILVDDPDEPAGLGDEVVMVLSDIGIDEKGNLRPPDAGGDLGSVFGREGDVLLVNGRVQPTMRARAGRRQRWRIVNAARSRYYWLDLGGVPFVRIGGDAGRSSAVVESERLLLLPGERADVLVTPVSEPGEVRELRWIPYDRGYGTAFERPEVTLLTIEAADLSAEEQAPAPDVSRAVEALATDGAMEVQIELTMEQTDDGTALGINGVPFENAAPIVGAVGETQVWSVKNTMAWAHPFHLHGFFFQVLGDDGAPAWPVEWRDTADVPVDGTLRFAVRYDPRPGMWMFHCHILDHADLGMMGMVDVQK
ncbi:MAG: multicopper oxidase family protein [Polyangiaceae bacterium]